MGVVLELKLSDVCIVRTSECIRRFLSLDGTLACVVNWQCSRCINEKFIMGVSGIDR